MRAYTDLDREQQLDLCHYGRTTSHTIRENDVLSRADREKLVAGVTDHHSYLNKSGGAVTASVSRFANPYLVYGDVEIRE